MVSYHVLYTSTVEGGEDMGRRRTQAAFEVLGTDEKPKRCRCVTTALAAMVACSGPNNGVIKPGQRHYVMRNIKTGRIIGRYCGIECRDNYTAAFND